MSEPFLAEIRMVGFNFAPRGWAFCDGQILPINQNQSLYSLLGTTYGGDGRTSFALPDLRGRAPIHVGQSAGGTIHTLGEKSGEESETLTQAEIPSHDHDVSASADVASLPVPAGNQLADSAPNENWHSPTNLQAMHSATIANAGGGQGHENMQPWLALHFCIALQGLFPSRN
jgi:microcystin-dependent protein